jgi:hypothetical protein
VNRSTGRSGIFDPEIALKTLTWGRGATPQNRTLSRPAGSSKAVSGTRRGKKETRFEKNRPSRRAWRPCATIHPWADTCTACAVDRWQNVFRWIAPVYAGRPAGSSKAVSGTRRGKKETRFEKNRPSRRAWRISEPCLPVNRSTGRSGIFDPEIALKTLTWGRGATTRCPSFGKKAARVSRLCVQHTIQSPDTD